MSVAGLAVDLLFPVFGIPATAWPIQIVPTHFEWNCTTYLSTAFLLVAGLVGWPNRNRSRLGEENKRARDVVCGMQVERAQAPAADLHKGIVCYFYSIRCHDRLVAESPQYLKVPGIEPMTSMGVTTISATAEPSLTFRRYPSCQHEQ